MQRITCKSRYGQQELDVSGFIGKSVWKNGETRSCTDDEAKVLLENVNFILTEKGFNPYFTCSVCGQFTNDGGAVDHVKRTRVCVQDQQKARDEAVEATKPHPQPPARTVEVKPMPPVAAPQEETE